MTQIMSSIFGVLPSGERARLYELTNNKGMKVSISNFGAAIVSVSCPDKAGNPADVVLGFGSLEGYLNNEYYLGVVIGRYANRIAHARFSLDGQIVSLEKNDGQNHLHGGSSGFHTRLWSATTIPATSDSPQMLQLSLASPDGDANYPGALQVLLTYSLTDNNELILHYLAKTTKNTICNLTNHSYFNLSGHDHGCVENHTLQINANEYTPVDNTGIPTGEIASVIHTPFDFRAPKPIKEALAAENENQQLRNVGGIDHNFVLTKPDDPRQVSRACLLCDESSRRTLEVFTNMPGVQCYSGNFLARNARGKNNFYYGKRSGLCLETQFFPDAINHPAFPSPILTPQQMYDYTTVYKFSVNA